MPDGSNIVSSKSEVRRATAMDAVNLLRCISPMTDEATYQLPPVQAGPALHWIIEVIERGIVTVATIDGRVIGSLGFVLDRWPWNADVWHLRHTWLYVRPKADGTRSARVAFALFREWLKEYKGLANPRPAAYFGINLGGSQDELHLKEMLAQRFGFVHIGANMVLAPLNPTKMEA